jgi:hypothetical protein
MDFSVGDKSDEQGIVANGNRRLSQGEQFRAPQPDYPAAAAFNCDKAERFYRLPFLHAELKVANPDFTKPAKAGRDHFLPRTTR